MKAGLVAEIPQNIVPSLDTPAEYTQPMESDPHAKEVVEIPPPGEPKSSEIHQVWESSPPPESEMP